MIAREALAVIDHNCNVGREQVNIIMCTFCVMYVWYLQAVTKDGAPRVRAECDRAGAKWSVREVKTAKNYQFRDEIAREILQVK